MLLNDVARSRAIRAPSHGDSAQEATTAHSSAHWHELQREHNRSGHVKLTSELEGPSLDPRLHSATVALVGVEQMVSRAAAAITFGIHRSQSPELSPSLLCLHWRRSDSCQPPDAMTPLIRGCTARVHCSVRQPLTSSICRRSFAQAAAAQQSSPSFALTSLPSTPATSSSSALVPASDTATLPNSRLWRFRPTHRRFPLSNRHNPATPLNFRPVTPPPTTPPHPHTPTRVPFTITRTRSHALPVYLDYRGGGTLVTTCVRRVEGDVDAMARQLQLLVGDRTRVVVRPGRVEVKGNYVEETRRWLKTIGF